jgi:hypothetical protein
VHAIWVPQDLIAQALSVMVRAIFLTAHVADECRHVRVSMLSLLLFPIWCNEDLYHRGDDDQKGKVN